MKFASQIARCLALSKSKDYKINTFPAYSAIRAKMTMEDLGIIEKDFFTFGGFEQLPTEDQLLLLETEKNLTQRGYGLLKKIYSFFSSSSDVERRFSALLECSLG